MKHVSVWADPQLSKSLVSILILPPLNQVLGQSPLPAECQAAHWFVCPCWAPHQVQLSISQITTVHISRHLSNKSKRKPIQAEVSQQHPKFENGDFKLVKLRMGGGVSPNGKGIYQAAVFLVSVQLGQICTDVFTFPLASGPLMLRSYHQKYASLDDGCKL